MPPSQNLAAYSDCVEHFERALSSEKGIALTLPSKGEAIRMSQRLHACRDLHRKQSRKVYPEDHPSYGKTDWDHFKVSKDPDNDCRLLIQPYSQNVLTVEEL